MRLPQFARDWLLGLLAYPFAGFVTSSVVGPVDSVASALFGGVVVGLSVGSAQYLALRKGGVAFTWITATVVGSTLGALLGIALAGYSVETSGLLVRGAVTALLIAVLQSIAVHLSFVYLLAWTITNAIAWMCGWWVTSRVIKDLERQFAVFGSTGAAVACLIQLSTAIFVFIRPSTRGE